MFTSYDNAKTALNILDKMLDQEKQNLEQASKSTTTELLNG
jgi:CheY-specific phosphatase CheX